MRRLRGFTLVELLVVVGIITLLIALLLPALHKARHQAKLVQCMSNMRQTLTATISYSYQFKDYPWNIWPDSDRTGITITDNSNTTYNNQTHGLYFPEGHCWVAYWLHYLLQYRYLGSYKGAGCSFEAGNGWDVHPYNRYGDLVGMRSPITDHEELRRHPPFIYRGPATTDDLRMNHYTCGQVAGTWSGGPNGRSGCNFPRATTKKRAILFHCPTFVRQAGTVYTGNEAYWAPHAGAKGIRRRDQPPMSNAEGHFLAQTVGWTDGSVQLIQQPRMEGAWYINYRGEVTQSTDSGL
jgi:prepilin-type N-terminal cleavage/methylation domain-containing protein